MKLKTYTRIAAGAALALCLTTQAQASGSGTMDDNILQELKRMIEQQQAQIDKQASEIAALKEQLGGNAAMIATKADKGETVNTDKMVTSSFKNVNLSLYGQVNKAMLYSDNGSSSKWYVVDNINSQTRLGLKASVEGNTGWAMGGRIEYGIVSNASTDVNQLDTFNATSSSFKLRWAEVSINNDKFGKVSLGKGSTATDSTSEVDLSGTTVASYASLADMAGGQLWYQGATNTLTNLAVKNVFSDMDGLSRQDRIRYDTPSFAGFSVAASGSSGDAFDGALKYSRAFGGTKVAAAFGLANPGDLISNVDVQYSGSASVLLPMGFNATFAAALQDKKANNEDDATFWWAKLGYKTKFYDAATTAFSIDYGENNDLIANGDKAKSWAIAAVHNITDWSTEFYMIYRNYMYESDFRDFDDINTFMAGARLKF